jgi:hypothetical protein
LAGIIRISGPRAYNNERIKYHSFNAREKRGMAASSASATPLSASATQLSASAAASARVVSNRDETSRLCGAVGRSDGRTNERDVRGGCIFLLLAVEEE